MRNHVCKLLCVSSIIALATTAHAQAQPAARAEVNSEGLGEIIVTARKRSESLFDVPVAVSAVSAEQIQRSGATDLTRLAQLTPQVILAQADSGTGASFSIRGLGTSFLDPGLEQSVTVVIDGVPVSRGNAVLMGMFDVEQLEVLKGPQALFFGKNSPAGVVSITSAPATDHVTGYVRAGYEFEAREKYAEAAISGPITDTLKARLAVRGTTMRGWLRNVAQPVSSPIPLAFGTYFPRTVGASHRYEPGADEIMGRGTFTWTPTDTFDATLKTSYGHRRDNGTTTQQYCPGGADANPVTVGGVPDPFNDCRFDDRTASGGIPPEFVDDRWEHARSDAKSYSRLDVLLASLTMNFEIGDDVALTSVSGYMDLDYALFNNQDYTSYALATVGISERTKTFSQELRLSTDYDGPVNFTLGGYYERMRRFNDSDSLIFNVGPVPAGLPNAGRYDNFFGTNYTTGRTLSAFGQMRWSVLDNLEVAGGVRFTEERRTIDSGYEFVSPNFIAALPNLIPAGIRIRGRNSDTNWSPEFTVTYKPTTNLMVFAAYKTGYKTGGFPALTLINRNANGTVPTGDQFGFGPERAKGFEAGLKGRFLDNTVRVELTAYNYKYIGLQQSNFDPATFAFKIENAASARVKGVELAVNWLPIPELRLNGAVAYNRARYISYRNAQCYTAQTAALGCTDRDPGPLNDLRQDLSGRTLPRAPEWNAQAGASYDVDLSDAWRVGLNGDVNYTSGYATQETQPPFGHQDHFALFNAGVRLYSPDSRYELALIGRNLANKYYVQVSTATTFGIGQGNLHAATPRPREVRVQATYRF